MMKIQKKFSTTRMLAVTIIAQALFLSALTTQATANTLNFDTAPSGYSLVGDGAGTASLSTDYALSPTTSAKLTLNNTQADFAKVVIDVTPGDLKLGDAAGTFYSYIPDTGSNPAYLPYMYFAVDSNENGLWDFGNGDSFVIAFITGAPAPTFDTWIQSGINGGTDVHVVGGRQGLLGGEYTSSGGADLLSNLNAESIGSGSWGDLNVLQIRVGAGATGGDLGSYVSYVDNIVTVPEPATIGLLAFAGIGTLLTRRRRKV